MHKIDKYAICLWEGNRFDKNLDLWWMSLKRMPLVETTISFCIGWCMLKRMEFDKKHWIEPKVKRDSQRAVV